LDLSIRQISEKVLDAIGFEIHKSLIETCEECCVNFICCEIIIIIIKVQD